jgi:hypothetical protein
MFTFLINFTAYSKLGVPIKTTISPTVLEEAMNGTVTVRPLPVGTSATGKVNATILVVIFYKSKMYDRSLNYCERVIPVHVLSN